MAGTKQCARKAYPTQATTKLAPKPGMKAKTGSIVDSSIKPDTMQASRVSEFDVGMDIKGGVDGDANVGLEEEEWEQKEWKEKEGEERAGEGEEEGRVEERGENDGSQGELDSGIAISGSTSERLTTKDATPTSLLTKDRQPEGAGNGPQLQAMAADQAENLYRAGNGDRKAIAAILRNIHQTSAYVNATAEQKAQLQEQGCKKTETQRRIANGLHASVDVPQAATQGEADQSLQRLKEAPTPEEIARAALYKSLDVNVSPRCRKAISNDLHLLRRTSVWAQATLEDRIRMNEKTAERVMQRWSATRKDESTRGTGSRSKPATPSSEQRQRQKFSNTPTTDTPGATTISDADSPRLAPRRVPKTATGFLRIKKDASIATASSVPSPPSPKRLRKTPKAVTGVLWDFSKPPHTWAMPTGSAVGDTNTKTEHPESYAGTI